MKQEIPLLLATEDSFFADLIASTVGAGYRVVPAYGNVKQTIDLLAETRAELLLLCYNDIGRSERLYLDLMRDLPAALTENFRTVVMSYRGHEAQAAQLCHRHNLLDYVVAGPTLDVQRLHYVLRTLARSKTEALERREIRERLDRAGALVDRLFDLRQQTETVARDADTLPPPLAAALEKLRAGVEEAVKAGHQANLRGKKSILIVDDDPLLREICASGLEDAGYHVFEASDAPEGIGVLERDRVDLILMDLMLPGLDGIAATRKIRAMPKFKSVPVLMLTGHSDPETVRTCGQAGAVGFLVKPIDQTMLVEKIRRHLAPA
jgi:two-component system chemotaxis response regulator CheY